MIFFPISTEIYSIASMNKNQNVSTFEFLTMIENDNFANLKKISTWKSDNFIKRKFKQHARFDDSHANDIDLHARKRYLMKNLYISLNADCFEILSSGMKIHFFDKITKKLFK